MGNILSIKVAAYAFLCKASCHVYLVARRCGLAGSAERREAGGADDPGSNLGSSGARALSPLGYAGAATDSASGSDACVANVPAANGPDGDSEITLNAGPLANRGRHHRLCI